jgi:hypothetical protein
VKLRAGKESREKRVRAYYRHKFWSTTAERHFGLRRRVASDYDQQCQRHHLAHVFQRRAAQIRDPNGHRWGCNRASLAFPRYSFTYIYSGRNQLKEIKSGATTLATYGFDLDGKLLSSSLKNSQVATVTTRLRRLLRPENLL